MAQGLNPAHLFLYFEFNWNAAMLIPLHIVYDCFQGIMTEFEYS